MIPPALVAAASRRAQPLTAYLELTYACNWRCAFCYNPRHSDRRRLGRPEWAEVMDDLRELGGMQVTLTGGEPLAHPEFFGIAADAAERRILVRIFTNGSLVDERGADALRDIAPLAVEMSLHGAKRETHDRATGTHGSFEAMWNAVGLLRDREVRVALKSPLTCLNEGEIDAMYALAASHCVPLRIDPQITPRDDGDASPLAFEASVEAKRDILRRGVEAGLVGPIERRSGDANCGLGRLTLAVDPEGNVYPCLQWRQSSVGNVRETRLRSMWQLSPERKAAARIADEATEALLHDESTSFYAFCPALAFQRGGDPLLADAGFSEFSSLVADLLKA